MILHISEKGVPIKFTRELLPSLRDAKMSSKRRVMKQPQKLLSGRFLGGHINTILKAKKAVIRNLPMDFAGAQAVREPLLPSPSCDKGVPLLQLKNERLHRQLISGRFDSSREGHKSWNEQFITRSSSGRWG